MQRQLTHACIALVVACGLPATRATTGSCRGGMPADGTMTLIRGRESDDPRRDRALIVEVRERRGRDTRPLSGASVRLYAPHAGPPDLAVVQTLTHDAGRGRLHVPTSDTYTVRVNGVAHRGAVAELQLRSEVQDTLRVEITYHGCPIE